MSLLFFDSFDHYSSTDILKKWSVQGATATIIAGGRRATNCMHVAASTWIYKNLPVASAVLIVGFAIKFKSALNNNFCDLRDNGNSHISFKAESNGSISVYRGGWSGTQIAVSSIGLVTSESFYHFQAKVVFHPTAGSVVIRINNSEVLNATGLNTMITANATADQIYMQGFSQSIEVDDLYVCNSLGTRNNDFLGDCEVDALFPTSDGTYTAFTPSTGTSHFALVDETTPNTTDYNSSATVGQRDSYGYQDLAPLITQNIYGVQVCAAATKSDPGSKSINTFARTGTVDVDAPAQVMTATSQLYYLSIFETDPTTAASWTEAGVNGAQFGARVAG